MKLSNLILAKQIFNYILENSNCTIPDIKDQLSIQTSKPPKTQEMQLYRIIQSMEKEKYITKNKISNIYPGGPQFRLKITKKGISEFSKIDKTRKKEDIF